MTVCARQLLNFQNDGGNDAMGKEQMFYSETLAWNVYDSVSRRAALSSCGWAGKFDLTNVMAECEALGEYERSAALAVWHEDMGAAVECLQRASETISLQIREEGENRFSPLVTTQYSLPHCQPNCQSTVLSGHTITQQADTSLHSSCQ